MRTVSGDAHKANCAERDPREVEDGMVLSCVSLANGRVVVAALAGIATRMLHAGFHRRVSSSPF